LIDARARLQGAEEVIEHLRGDNDRLRFKLETRHEAADQRMLEKNKQIQQLESDSVLAINRCLDVENLLRKLGHEVVTTPAGLELRPIGPRQEAPSPYSSAPAGLRKQGPVNLKLFLASLPDLPHEWIQISTHTYRRLTVQAFKDAKVYVVSAYRDVIANHANLTYTFPGGQRLRYMTLRTSPDYHKLLAYHRDTTGGLETC
jgi:hypothetical protein